MNNNIIEIKSLRKDYHVGEVTVHALRGVDLKIHEGNSSPLWEQAGRESQQCLISSDVLINRLLEIIFWMGLMSIQ